MVFYVIIKSKVLKSYAFEYLVCFFRWSTHGFIICIKRKSRTSNSAGTHYLLSE